MSAKKSWTEDGNDSDRALESDTELKVAEETTPAHSGADEAALRDVGTPVRGSADRRLAYRLALASGRASIEVPGAGRVQVCDISALGGSLLVDDLNAFPESGLVAAILYLADEPSFFVYLRVVRRTRAPQSSAFQVGVSFGALDASSLGALSRFMVREYISRGFDIGRLLASPDAVRSDIRKSILTLIRGAAIRDEARLQVFRDGAALAARVQVVALAGESGAEEMVGVIHGDDSRIEPSDALTFLIPGANSVVLFESEVRERHGDHLVLSLPAETIQTGFRESHRTPATTDQTVRISFQHPHLLDHTITREALDVSARGLAFPMDLADDLLFPGDRLSDIHLILPGGVDLCASGTIRSMRRGKGTSLQCGIEILDFASEPQARAWHRFVFRYQHPRIAAASPQTISDVWSVYESSTYVEKWIPEGQSEEVLREFSDDWLHLRQDTGRLLLLREQDQPVATVAVSQSYPKTWLFHGLAVDQAQRDPGVRDQFFDMARELYSSVAYTLQHQSDCKYILSYFADGSGWNQRLIGDFAERYGAGSEQLYEFGHIWRKRVSDDGADRVSAPNVQIDRASAADRALVSSSAGRQFPKMLVDALSLSEAEIDMSSFTRAAAMKGLYCAREIFIVREDGIPKLAAICETGSTGINIFGLMNLCWTIPLGTSPLSEAGHKALMAEVTEHYRRSEVAEFLLLDEPRARFELLESMGFVSVSPAVRWLARVEVLPAWLAYVENDLLAQRTRSLEQAPVRGRD